MKQYKKPLILIKSNIKINRYNIEYIKNSIKNKYNNI